MFLFVIHFLLFHFIVVVNIVLGTTAMGPLLRSSLLQSIYQALILIPSPVSNMVHPDKTQKSKLFHNSFLDECSPAVVFLSICVIILFHKSLQKVRDAPTLIINRTNDDRSVTVHTREEHHLWLLIVTLASNGSHALCDGGRYCVCFHLTHTHTHRTNSIWLHTMASQNDRTHSTIYSLSLGTITRYTF